MSPAPDDIHDRLDRAVPSPTAADVDAALEAVRRRSSRGGSGRVRWIAGVAAAAALIAVVAGIGVTAMQDEPEEVRAGPADPSPATRPTAATSPMGGEWPDGWLDASPPPRGPKPAPEEISEARQATLEVLGLGADGSGTNDLLLSSSNLIPAGGVDDEHDISLDLRADGWPLAQDIAEAVGPVLQARAVAITVGNRSFPDGTPVGDPSCPIIVEQARALGGGGAPDITARIELESDTVVSGADLSGRVVAFATSAPVTYETGVTEVGLVVRRGTTGVVGTWPGVMASLGKTVTIDRSGAVLDLVAGTTRCSTEGPPGLAPGVYDLVWGLTPPDRMDPVTIVARTPITITE